MCSLSPPLFSTTLLVCSHAVHALTKWTDYRQRSSGSGQTRGLMDCTSEGLKLPYHSAFLTLAWQCRPTAFQPTENCPSAAEDQFRPVHHSVSVCFLQLEVSQLEGSLQQPKAQSSMSPYLVPDTAALCQHLNLIRQLAGSGCFIIIIPRTGQCTASSPVCPEQTPASLHRFYIMVNLLVSFYCFPAFLSSKCF